MSIQDRNCCSTIYHGIWASLSLKGRWYDENVPLEMDKFSRMFLRLSLGLFELAPCLIVVETQNGAAGCE